MNLLLLFPDDFFEESKVRLSGRRFEHASNIHRAVVGDSLTVGIANGGVGRGTVTSITSTTLEMEIDITSTPPPPAPATLLIALPRPKVLNRVILSSVSIGIKTIVIFNCWRVEKSYWESPRLSDDNLTLQVSLGLEQAKDTALPVIQLRKKFRPFVEDELPLLVEGTVPFVAHPAARDECPRNVGSAITLAVGPEGGFIQNEIAMLETIGFQAIHAGPRPLRVEAVIPYLLGRIL